MEEHSVCFDFSFTLGDRNWEENNIAVDLLFLLFIKIGFKKSSIRETLTLLTDADNRTDKKKMQKNG